MPREIGRISFSLIILEFKQGGKHRCKTKSERVTFKDHKRSQQTSINPSNKRGKWLVKECHICKEERREYWEFQRSVARMATPFAPSRQRSTNRKLIDNGKRGNDAFLLARYGGYIDGRSLQVHPLAFGGQTV